MTIYPALSVTVTTTAQKLLTLLQAIDNNIAPRGREVTLQNDAANATVIRVGSASVSSTNCGYGLAAGDSRTYRAGDSEGACLPNMYVRCDAGTAQLNVEIIPRS